MKIHKSLLDGIEQLLRSLIKHYDEKIAVLHKRATERNIAPIIDEVVRRKIYDKFPERGAVIIEAMVSCPDKKDMGKKLLELGLTQEEVNAVFQCMQQGG